MRRWLGEHWPLLAGMGVCWGTLAVLVAMAVSRNQGHWVYGLDDAYIHMAIAKHLVQHGVWGVTPYAFSSAASSLLWPLLLALCYLVTGVGELAPLVLNLAAVTGLLVMVYRLGRERLPGWAGLAVVLGVTFGAGLPAVTLTGMEHVLQALLALAWCWLAARAVATKEAGLGGPTVGLLALAPLVTMARYEGGFLVAAAALLLALRRRWLPALAVAGLAALPLAVYGRISFAHGWSWFPSSVLLKGLLYQPPYQGVVGLVVSRLGMSRLSLLTGAALAVYLARGLRSRRWWEPEQALLLLFGVAALGHLLCIPEGELRYETYLAVVGLAAVPLNLFGLLQEIGGWAGRRPVAGGAAVLGLALLAVLPSPERAASIGTAVIASTNIYQQQYQMGRFLRRYYQGQGVAANDIGAIDYLADLRLVDVWGLGTREVAAARLAEGYSSPVVEGLARAQGVRVAILYYEWFEPLLPRQWVAVGTWTIPNNVACGRETVTFLATDPQAARELGEHLADFAGELPAEVRQEIGESGGRLFPEEG